MSVPREGEAWHRLTGERVEYRYFDERVPEVADADNGLVLPGEVMVRRSDGRCQGLGPRMFARLYTLARGGGNQPVQILVPGLPPGVQATVTRRRIPRHR